MMKSNLDSTGVNSIKTVCVLDPTHLFSTTLEYTLRRRSGHGWRWLFWRLLQSELWSGVLLTLKYGYRRLTIWFDVCASLPARARVVLWLISTSLDSQVVFKPLDCIWAVGAGKCGCSDWSFEYSLDRISIHSEVKYWGIVRSQVEQLFPMRAGTRQHDEKVKGQSAQQVSIQLFCLRPTEPRSLEHAEEVGHNSRYWMHQRNSKYVYPTKELYYWSVTTEFYFEIL